MFKDPLFLNVHSFEGNATQAAQGSFSHYFMQLNPTNPSYQFYLIHEYYSFKAQILFDDKMAPAGLKLDPANKEYFQKNMEWTHSQLSAKNKEFVQQHPDPSILVWLNRFYQQPNL